MVEWLQYHLEFGKCVSRFIGPTPHQSVAHLLQVVARVVQPATVLGRHLYHNPGSSCCIRRWSTGGISSKPACTAGNNALDREPLQVRVYSSLIVSSRRIEMREQHSY